MYGSFKEIFQSDNNINSDSLKMEPCPLCGSSFSHIDTIAFCEPELYKPVCLDCGATLYPKTLFEDMDDAIKTWNQVARIRKSDGNEREVRSYSTRNGWNN